MEKTKHLETVEAQVVGRTRRQIFHPAFKNKKANSLCSFHLSDSLHRCSIGRVDHGGRLDDSGSRTRRQDVLVDIVGDGTVECRLGDLFQMVEV